MNILTRTAFNTDKEYQEYYKKFFTDKKFDDGYAYLLSVDTGFIKKGKKMELTPKKISKSDKKEE